MALDGGMLRCLAEELRKDLIGARADKIYQPSRDELVIHFRGKSGAKKLYFSAKGQSPRVHFISRPLENPPAPPMFCMLLRKHLSGGVLTGIRQDGLERVLSLDFRCLNELGDTVVCSLICEMTGRNSNILLVGANGKVTDAIHRVNAADCAARPVVPGITYTPLPPLPERLSPLEADGRTVADAARRRGGELSDALLKVTQGFSPLYCREIAHLALRGKSLPCESMNEEQWERTAFFIDRFAETLRTGERRQPVLLRDTRGNPLAMAYTVITQYGLSAIAYEMPDFSALVEAFYAQQDRVERLRRRSRDILKVLVTASARVERKLQRQREELAASGKRDTYRLYGDLLIGAGQSIPPGAESADLVNYYDPQGERVTVPLDPALSASRNAQCYYKAYRKAAVAQQKLTEQIRAGEEEQRYLDSVLDALSRAQTTEEMNEIRRELAQGGYIRTSAPGAKAPLPLAPMRFLASDGTLILVGRNNVQNDALTLKTAKGSDIWLHTKDIPGAHVIVRLGGNGIADETLHQAAVLAATYSKAAASSRVPVDYTLARYVHKPSGARPGMVIYDHQRTLFVVPDEALANRLRAAAETEPKP